MDTKLPRIRTATFEDGSQVLITEWPHIDFVQVACRPDAGARWGPPAAAELEDDEVERAANHYQAQAAGIR